MEILYKQPKSDVTALEDLGIRQCYLKMILMDRDRGHVTAKEHHHTGFEIHMIENGEQIYEISGKTVCVKAGEMLWIPPLVKHRATAFSSGTTKHSITFFLDKSKRFRGMGNATSIPIIKGTPHAVSDCIRRIGEEKRSKDVFYASVIGGRILECILLLLRAVGIGDSAELPKTDEEDSRFLLAKQYIRDNIRLALTVSDVAAYACLSPKQLTRIFEKEEGLAVAAYIRRERCFAIERLLSETALSLREVSEAMHFNNEYYFNAFFKKHAGMTPGAYRASVLKNTV